MKKEELYCQSCGMPLSEQELFGTEQDGSASRDYCIFCYKDGAFTADLTMEQMIEHCIKFLDEYNEVADETLTVDQARSVMLESFPQLKRWKA